MRKLLNHGLLRRVVSVGFFQSLAQLANALTGFLIIRALGKEEYAAYALFYSVLSAVVMVSGIGIHMGMSVIGGRVWQNRTQLGRLVRTLEGMRMGLFKWCLVPFAAYTLWLFWKNGLDPWLGAASLAVVLVVTWLQIHANLKFDVAKLLGRTDILNRYELLPAVVRLGVVAASLWLLRGQLVPILLATLLSYFLQYWMVNREVASLYEEATADDDGYRRETFSFFKADALNIVYFVLQGQVTVILLSLFTGVASVANVTALGRIMVIFAILNATLAAVVTPVFAKEHDLGRLRSKFARASAAYIGLLVAMCAVAYFFPDALLWVLGGRYAHLRGELFVMVVGSCFSQYVVFMYGLIATKGWVRYQWLFTPLSILNQIILFLALDLTTEMGVIWYGALGHFGYFAINCLSLWLGFSGRNAKPVVA